MSRAQATVVTTTILNFLATVFVVLRVISRFFILKKPSADDYLIAFGLVISWALTALTIARKYGNSSSGIQAEQFAKEVHFGLGRHQDSVSPEDYQNMLLCFYLWYPVYNITLTIAKLSAMFQFLRFFVMRGPRIAAWVLISIVSTYGIAISIASLCSCLPVQSFWIQALPGVCIDFTIYWYFNSSFNVTTDIAVVVLPLYVLKDLRLPRRQKWAVLGVFMVGVLTCITSAVRLHTVRVLLEANDNTWDNAPPALWSAVEANTAIICACMQSLKPLVQKVRPAWFEHSQSSSAFTTSSAVSFWKMGHIRRTGNSSHVTDDVQTPLRTEPVLGPMLGSQLF